jgi:acyl carrier protein
MIDFDSFRGCVADVLDFDPDGVGSNTPLPELPGWDSVNGLRVLNALESEFRVRLGLSAFSSAKTVGELHGLIDEGSARAT